MSHLHMSYDTVQLAQLNRNAKEVAAQKVATEFVVCSKFSGEFCRIEVFDAGFLSANEAQAK